MSSHRKRINRVSVSKIDKLLGKKFKVLDDGFICLVDYMGTDESIVQAARVSYGEGTKKISEDKGLIRYLMRHHHTTPFEMCEIKFHLRVPMDCWRQWIRHRTANVNEYSTRYSIAIDATKKTQPNQWRLQNSFNKQGSEGFLETLSGKILSKKEKEFHEQARNLYYERINVGVAREQARKDLPLSTYTEAYWKIDLHNLLHFLELRMDQHAQYEIRQYANIIGNNIVSKWCPLTWEAFLDYRLNSIALSKIEVEIIQLLFSGDKGKAIKRLKDYGLLTYSNGILKKNREREEFEVKLKKMSIIKPW